MNATRQPTRRFIQMLFAPILAVLLLAGCAQPKPPEQLVFADPGNPIATLIYIAEAQGYFRDENLTLTYKQFTSGLNAMNSVLAGEADFGVAVEFPFANMLMNGKALRILCTIERTNQNAAVVARRDRGIGSAIDLNGKRVGLAPGSNSDFVLSVILREVGLPDDAATRVALKPEQMATALADGEVDAVTTWMPHSAAAQARFAADATALIRTAAYTELSPLGVRPQTLVDKREALQRLLAALVRAEDFVHEHNDAALQIVIARFGANAEAGLRQVWPGLHFTVRLDNLLLTALTNEGAWLAMRANPAMTVPDYRAAFAPEFLEAIRPQSVTVAPAGGR